MSIVKYNGKQYDLETLVRISGRGIVIQVDVEDLCDKETKAFTQRNNFEHGERLLVCANGDKYDVLSGALVITPKGTPAKRQQCWLMSKFVLKTACVETLKNSIIDLNPTPEYAHDRYDSRPRQGYQRNNRY